MGYLLIFLLPEVITFRVSGYNKTKARERHMKLNYHSHFYPSNDVVFSVLFAKKDLFCALVSAVTGDTTYRSFLRITTKSKLYEK